MDISLLVSIIWTSLFFLHVNTAKVELVYYTLEYGMMPSLKFGTWTWSDISVSKNGESNLEVRPSPTLGTTMLFRHPRGINPTEQGPKFRVSIYMTVKDTHEFTVTPERILLVCPGMEHLLIDQLTQALEYYASGNLSVVAKLTKRLSCAVFEHVSDDSSDESGEVFDQYGDHEAEGETKIESV